MFVSNVNVNFYTASEVDHGQRLDNLLARYLKGVGRGYIHKIIRTGQVRINGKKQKFYYKVQIGDLVRVPPVRINTNVITPNYHYKLNVLFEDKYYLIIDKPHGLACHGGSGVSYGVIESIRAENKYKYIQLAHRLDKDTSGILTLCKKRSALVTFQDLLQRGEISKYYNALVVGNISNKEFDVNAPLHKFIINGERFVKVDKRLGKPSLSRFKVIGEYGDFTLLKVELLSGRTHQIRVHTKFIGHPLVMDAKYGDDIINKSVQNKLKRMFLHAYKLTFTHPFTMQKICVVSNLANDLSMFLYSLK